MTLDSHPLSDAGSYSPSNRLRCTDLPNGCSIRGQNRRSVYIASSDFQRCGRDKGQEESDEGEDKGARGGHSSELHDVDYKMREKMLQVVVRALPERMWVIYVFSVNCAWLLPVIVGADHH